jgi:ABC-type nickel/cobalt efflux system permease component RcnA
MAMVFSLGSKSRADRVTTLPTGACKLSGERYILVCDYAPHQSNRTYRFVGTIVMKLSRLLFSLLAPAALLAHPMGNFSVNHYTRIAVGARDANLLYVLDLAEIPTFEIMKQWKLERSSPRADLDRAASEQAREWSKKLTISINGRSVSPQFQGAELTIADGAGGLPVARIAARLRLPVSAGSLEFEDGNYPDRAGWKEIVIQAEKGAAIEKATQGDQDRSRMLTEYPQDPTLAPPQDLKAAVEWSSALAVAEKKAPVIAPVPQPPPPVAKSAEPATAPTPPGQNAPGTVVRGDYLSTMLHNRELSLGMTLIGIAVAFGLGAMHAFSPGHGKTIVAAYLVGSRGTAMHAVFLGGMVTFTHTISVFMLGFVTLFLSKYVAPEKISPVLETVASLSIVWIGALLLYKRIRGLKGHSHDGAHHHHDHDHNHDHDHHHGPGGHTHVIEGEVTMGSLIALGASGGLVPCPSALILLLAAIRFDRIGLGLILLVAFSLGLAAVLMAIGLMVLYAKHFLPDSEKTRSHPAFRLIPVFSAGLILCIGLVMTGVSLGVINPVKLIG